jgi:hypothetical protein
MQWVNVIVSQKYPSLRNKNSIYYPKITNNPFSKYTCSSVANTFAVLWFFELTSTYSCVHVVTESNSAKIWSRVYRNTNSVFGTYQFVIRGPLMVAQWLRYRATNRNVAGSIPDGITEIFHWHNPSDRTMALGSTQPLTEMSTRNISWGVKAAGA